jgi:hypothetical protein
MTEEPYSESYIVDVLKANNRIDFVESYYGRINTFHHYLDNRFLARTFYEAFKNQDRSATIYSAALSSIEATMYIKKTFSNEKLYFFVFYPVVIFNGNLFEAYIYSDKSPDVKESKHIKILFSYIPRKTSNDTYYEKPDKFIIDVIQYEYLEEFLKLIEDEQGMLERALLF